MGFIAQFLKKCCRFFKVQMILHLLPSTMFRPETLFLYDQIPPGMLT